jgi:hypothetical protein
MNLSKALVAGAAGLALLATSGCEDLMKPKSTWSRSDTVRLSSEELYRVASRAYLGVELRSYGDVWGFSSSRTESVSKGSATFALRKGFWLVTGLPVTIVGGAVAAVVFLVPSGGKSVLFLGLPLISLDDKLAENRMTVTYNIVCGREGETVGTCTVHSVGMTKSARNLKDRLWAELDVELGPYMLHSDKGTKTPSDTGD